MPLTQRQKDTVTKALVDGGVCDAASASAFFTAVGNIRTGAGAGAGAAAGTGAGFVPSRNPNIDDSPPA